VFQVYHQGKKAIDYKADFFFFDMMHVSNMNLNCKLQLNFNCKLQMKFNWGIPHTELMISTFA
jgi:hypothetical protein